MSGDGVLIRAVITVHLRLPPAQVLPMSMMRFDSDGAGNNDTLDASSCVVAPNGKTGNHIRAKPQHAADNMLTPSGLAPLKSQRSPLIGDFGVFSLIDR